MESEDIAWADTCDGAAMEYEIMTMCIGEVETFPT